MQWWMQNHAHQASMELFRSDSGKGLDFLAASGTLGTLLRRIGSETCAASWAWWRNAAQFPF
jgi:hypothetical protein